MSIRLLDDMTISKIAAGEIIENPASIVKELLENSIDASAKNIVIEVKNDPSEYIRVTDDGEGISKNDLSMAFLRHSTSKLEKVEDLNNILTLGFRGEALASISNISKIKILTKHKSDSAGIEADIIEGKLKNTKNVGIPEGTTFIIKDVFYNLPVRKKYLKSSQIEFNHIYDIVNKIALGNSNISIKLIKDNKIIINSIRNKNILNNIYSILGRDIASNLIEIAFNSQSYRIKGFISNNKLYRSSRIHQYIYINGRYIRNLDISKAMEKNYTSLIPLNRFPVFILFIDIDPILVDVNIHPKKEEIKLSQENAILEILTNLVKDYLFPNRKIINPLKEEKKESFEEKKNFNIFTLYEEKNLNKKENNNDRQNYFYDNYPSKKSSFLAKEEEAYFGTLSNDEENCQEYDNYILNENIALKGNNNLGNTDVIDFKIENVDLVGVLFKTFIIFENKKIPKFYLIDQHAAHERVMYEKFLLSFKNKNISSQVLLNPEVIEISAMEKSKIEENIELFNSIGFLLEDFGNTFVVREVPTIFENKNYMNFIYDVINSIDNIKNGSYEADLYKIMRMACKAAVKAGDKLSNLEIESLMNSLIKCDNPYTCPHGRPTILEMNKSQIEKLFLRE